jgi:hypothetical protein
VGAVGGAYESGARANEKQPVREDNKARGVSLTHLESGWKKNKR